MALPNDLHALKLSFGPADARTGLPDLLHLLQRRPTSPCSDRSSSRSPSVELLKKRACSPAPTQTPKKLRLVDSPTASTESLVSVLNARPASEVSSTTSQTRETRDSLHSLFQSLERMDTRRLEHTTLQSSLDYVSNLLSPAPRDNVKSLWQLVDVSNNTQQPLEITTWTTTTNNASRSTTTPSSLEFTGAPTSDPSLLSNTLFNRHDKPKRIAETSLEAISLHKREFDNLVFERKVSRIVTFRKFAALLDVSQEALQRLELTEADFNHYRLGDRSQRRELLACERAGCTNHTRNFSGVCADHPCVVSGCKSHQRACSLCKTHYQAFRRLRRVSKKEINKKT